MRIAIDARELGGHPTGVGRFLAEILTAWNEIAAAHTHEFVLCAPQPVAAPPTPRLRISTVTRSGSGTMWEQTSLPRLLRTASADVLFAPGYSGPLLTRVPTVVVVHDVSFAAHPEWFGAREGARRRIMARLTTKRACKVITISEFSKREIVRYLGVPAEKIALVYPGATRLRSAAASVAGANPHRDECLVFYVGSIFNRRHVPELIGGFARLARKRPEVRLEIVGDNRTVPHIDVDSLIAATGLSDRIRARAYISDDDLGALYGAGRAFAFLSEYEGFGLTPLDALASGIPIVVLDTPVAREVYGAAATYVERPEPRLVEEALERALFDPSERARASAAAAAVVPRYSWTACAATILDILTSCAAT